MQLDAREHFTEIVTAAVGEYLEAEAELSAATEVADEDRLRTARFRALRLGGAAAIYLHHFADIVAKRPSQGLPDFESSVAKVREFLQAKGAVDLIILGDAADSLKHAVLTYRLPRQVEEAGQVLVVSRAYGVGRYGEGSFGGGEQVWILARSGQRSLTSVLRGVSTVWEGVLFG